jgi:hypothetical protein
MPLIRKDYITNKIFLSTYFTYPALKYKDFKACSSKIYSLKSGPFKINKGFKEYPPRNASPKDKLRD